MKYLLFIPVLLIVGIARANQVSRKHPLKKLQKRLLVIDHLCSDDNFYYFNHSHEQNTKHADKTSRAISKQIESIRSLFHQVPDSAPIRDHLSQFLRQWATEKIAASLLSKDGRFISDKNLLLGFFPYRKKRQWKTVFPIFKP